MQVFVSVDEIRTDEVKWIDARFSLQNPSLGQEKFNEEHIRGAVHWDLAEDLSDESQGGGRHPLPAKEQLTKLFRDSGLHLEDTIVIYDDGGSPFAARAWWILQYGGFANARILLEGYDELKTKGLLVDRETFVNPAQTTVEPNWQDQLFADRSDVEEVVSGKNQAVLVDARSPERYSGANEPIDKRAGHIPTARNMNWEALKTDGRYDVQNAADALKKTAQTDEPVIVYCGSGVTASPLFAALKELGYSNVKLYVGSFSDWISKDDAPVGTLPDRS